MDAMYTMINEKVGSLMVKDASGSVVGFVTQRDLLRCIVGKGRPPKSLYDGQSEPQSWNLPISHVMTPSKDLVYLSPRDTLEDARALMSVSGKRHIPVLHNSDLLGVISPKDIARALHLERAEDISAKASYVATVMPRKGVPLNTRLLEASEEERAEQTFALRSAVCNLPHPHKNSLGEDAFLLGPNMIGIADGVGSWWELDVDPAVYARALMQLARGSCVSLSADDSKHLRRPGQVLHEAWHQLSSSTVVGSSTACLVSLHPSKAELLAANVGDSGFLLLRNAGGSNPQADERRGFQGTLDAYGAQTRSGKTRSGHHVAFRSPQQLRAFNAPFQLGRAGDTQPGEPDDRFETPHDAALVRVPIKDGDVLVLATDGLFDNMPESDVLAILESHAGESEDVLARVLAERAQELSLDNSVDSPFAILAKDNDIMWGGGRPDDITVIVSTVVDTNEHEAPATFTPFAGPGAAPEVTLVERVEADTPVVHPGDWE